MQITEIDAAGTAKERALSAGEEHGFLWRLNNYWSYEEGDGGLYIQVESVSLSRAVPGGLGWAIGPFVDSVPRESLEFTLRATWKELKQDLLEISRVLGAYKNGKTNTGVLNAFRRRLQKDWSRRFG